ncbi:MAG TPA: tRNA lysidine(34) synthetase TilS [Candidatus Baltobacteraceae bacterium]|nr:tRNA lysidine(34) synthetase TilS [Candidatus Baltobacteraceae bacterium]
MRGSRPQAAVERIVERGAAIARGERVLVACSGGPDSVALVGVLHALRKPMRLELAVAHVNHGRASAWQDECIAARVAATYELPLEVIALDVAAHGEAALREARYERLLDCARRLRAGVVATAHHAEDQTETVLLALFRGAGLEGMGGMRPRRPLGAGVELVRPLLRVPAEALRRYCHTRALPYAVDPTNADVGLRRNAVRQTLAALRPLFPGLDEAVARAATLAGDEIDSHPRAQLRRLVRDTLDGDRGLRDVDFEHVEAAVRALESGGSGRFHMKAGVCLEVDRGAISGIKRS